MTYGEEVVPLTTLGPREQRHVQDAYEEAFEPFEREPFEDLLVRERDADATTWVLTGPAGPLAFATLSWPGPRGWTYLEYFAVDARLRGGGVGDRLWHELPRLFPAHAPRLVLEIHDPAGAPAGSPERETHERRRRFYLRRGAVELPFRGYVMPALHDGAAAAHPGLLLARLPDGVLPGADELAGLVRSLHVTSYGLPEGHPLTEAVLGAQQPHLSG